MRAALAIVGAIVLLLAGLTGVACGGHGVSPTGGASPSDRFAGSWASTTDVGLLHIVLKNGSYALDGTTLTLHDGKLGGATISGGPAGRVTLSLSLGGDRLDMRTQYKHVVFRSSYHRATKAEIENYASQANYSRLAEAIDAWRWKVGTYPAVSDVRPDGAFGRQMQPWPTNPYTGKPMAPGRQPGQYVYGFSSRGFSIKSFGPNGQGVSQEGAPGWIGGVVLVGRGTVTRPAAHARIVVRRILGTEVKPQFYTYPAATTDGRGRFEITIDAGTCAVRAILKGVGHSAVQTVTVKRGRHSRVTLQVARP
jgi:hypothetical protein